MTNTAAALNYFIVNFSFSRLFVQKTLAYENCEMFEWNIT